MSKPLASKAPVETADQATPMMAQYLSIKADYPDYLLFYRMGDFYELFFDDAARAAAALDITLTKRGQHLGEDIAMCGVPVHAAETYLARLIKKNFRVAVCEQMEDPAAAKARGAKSVVKRDVVRLVTPGTLSEDTLLDARNANYLVALGRAQADWALAWADMSTGAFKVMATDLSRLEADLSRLMPQEILLAQNLLADQGLDRALRDWRDALVPRDGGRADSGRAQERLSKFYGVRSMDGFGQFGRADLAAAGLIFDYLVDTQKGRTPRLDPLVKEAAGAVMLIDAATRRNLELLRSQDGGRAGSLLGCIDRTATGAGARLLQDWLAAPLTDAGRINARLDAVEYCLGLSHLRQDLREHLRRTPDLERALSRLSLGRGSPRDLAAIGQALGQAAAIREKLEAQAAKEIDVPAEMAAAAEGLGRHGALVDELSRALVPEPPALTRDGGFIAAKYDSVLDEFKTLRDEGRRLILALESRYRADTGLSVLKIKHNNVLGYHIDLPARHGDQLMAPPYNEVFIHRQTLANAVRFSTKELAELAGDITQAADRALAREQELFAELTQKALAEADVISRAAHALARLDAFAGLAELAAVENQVRPKVDDSLAFHVEAGRHPVVEAARRAENETFVANDCDLNDQRRLWLLTGPNMAGKSTFLRQNALIAVLAQIGAYVPARAAHIGIIDRLFSRVGASDDLAHGRSTFMVEMIETAAILNQASERSLVILDEIGRGTATYDGLSIAWATVEHLHDGNRCRGLFATHYHELTVLADRLDRLALYALKVKEWQGDLVFLHEVGEGAADRSYGIQVAKLAGLPATVVSRAADVLERLEKRGLGQGTDSVAADLPLFSAHVAAAKAPPKADPLREKMDAVRPDELAPRDALMLLYELKVLADKDA